MNITTDKHNLEICCGDIDSVLAARDGGADRVELCMALADGGVTPSLGLMRQARAVEGIAMNVLIRPRGGDFLYDEDEIQIMLADIRAAREVGADGVVIGALTPEGDIDIGTCRRLIAEAGGMSITFHRAFDVCRNPLKALEDVIALGCNRLLTSGQQPTAEQGIPLLSQLVEQSAGRLSIMPGSGVSEKNAAKILQATGAHEIHASARQQMASKMQYRNPQVSMGTPGTDEYARMVTGRSEVEGLRSKV